MCKNRTHHHLHQPFYLPFFFFLNNNVMQYLAWTVTMLATSASAHRWSMPVPAGGGDWKLVHLSPTFSCAVPHASPVKVIPDWTIYGLHNTAGQQQANNCNNESFPKQQLSCTIVYSPPAEANVNSQVTALKTQFTYSRWGSNYWVEPHEVWAFVSMISRYLAI